MTSLGISNQNPTRAEKIEDETSITHISLGYLRIFEINGHVVLMSISIDPTCHRPELHPCSSEVSLAAQQFLANFQREPG